MDDGLHSWVVIWGWRISVQNGKFGCFQWKNCRTCNHPWSLTCWWFSHSYKVWGNSIGIESSKDPGFGISISAIYLIGRNFTVNVWTQPGQDFKFQVSSFKASLFKSSCCNFNNNSVLHTINQGHREGLYHWQQCEQVPLTFIYEEAT